MSSLKGWACLVLVGGALSLGGCIRPLYGPTASGAPLQQVLSEIEVIDAVTGPGQERLGHVIRSELIFSLDGSGKPGPKKYKLAINAAETVQSTSTDAITGRADAALLNVTVRYSLTASDGRVVTAGLARSNATYFRDPQRFAALRAARDAETRAGKLAAEDIKQRVAAILAVSQ